MEMASVLFHHFLYLSKHLNATDLDSEEKQQMLCLLSHFSVFRNLCSISWYLTCEYKENLIASS